MSPRKTQKLRQRPQPSRPEWSDFERLVAAVQRALDPAATITWDDRIKKRQVDVRIESRIGSATLRVLIECRRYAKKIGVEQVEAWATKARTLGAHKSMMVTSSGFERGALVAAANEGVDTFVLKRADDEDWTGYLRGFQAVLNMLVPKYEDIMLVTNDGDKLLASRFDQLQVGAERTFVDRVLATIASEFVKKFGPATAEPRAMVGSRFAERVALLRDSGEIEIERIEFKHSLVSGMQQVVECTSPKDWVLLRLSPEGVEPERDFFEFGELKEIADRFRKGEPQRPARKEPRTAR